MSANTKIEWADHTFNPWEGCQNVGPGCDNCYAEARNARFAGGQAINWGPGAPRRRTSAKNWQLPVKWNADAAAKGIRYRVFCASLADVFDNEVPAEWRHHLWDLIESTPNLDWLVLTKRIGNARPMMSHMLDRASGWMPPDNFWLGATVVNQEEADRDIPKLLATPAAKRFLSMEPLLGDVRLGSWLQRSPSAAFEAGKVTNAMPAWTRLGSTAIDWVIAGGESGPGARPMHPDWARTLRDQCQTAGVPFLFKQWGEWTPGENVERQRGTVDTAFWWGDEWRIHPLNLATDGGHIDDEPDLYRVGKKEAGRHLDGRTWDGVPACQ